MVRIKYTSQPPPVSGDQRAYMAQEFKRIELALSVLVQLLGDSNIETPIQVGAPDSGGVGYRMLRIPN
jgi:hypothetical protein